MWYNSITTQAGTGALCFPRCRIHKSLFVGKAPLSIRTHVPAACVVTAANGKGRFAMSINPECYFCGKEAVVFTEDHNYCQRHGREITCLRCGKKFYSPDRSKYCSDKCRDYQPRKGARGTCLSCGKTFTRTSSSRRYCSKLCSTATTSRGRYIIFERDNFKCFYCGRSSYGDGMELEVDHVLCRSRGGKTIAGNLVTACVSCNSGKGFRLLKNSETIFDEIHNRNALAGMSDYQLIDIPYYHPERSEKN